MKCGTVAANVADNELTAHGGSAMPPEHQLQPLNSKAVVCKTIAVDKALERY